jgi:hypothetical protein
MRICNVTVHCTSTNFVLLDQVNYAFVSSRFEHILVRVVCVVRGRMDAAASLQRKKTKEMSVQLQRRDQSLHGMAVGTRQSSDLKLEA